jgi:hypothetical protein
VYHGFVRDPNKGGTATFNAPGAGKGAGEGTIPIGINDAGAIVRYYIDASGVCHGFLLTP